MLIKRLFLLICLFFSVISIIPVVSAIGISPAKLNFDYYDGFDETIQFTVNSAANSNDIVNVAMGGELHSFATVDTEKVNISDGKKSFSVNLLLPKDTGFVGEKQLQVVASEAPPDIPGFIAVTTTVVGKIIVFFPYPGVYLEIRSFDIPNINEGEKTKVVWNVKNRGKQDTSYTAKLKIVDSELDEIVIEKNYNSPRFVSVDSEDVYRETIDTSSFKPGVYTANLEITYNGEKKSSSRNFMVGEEAVELVSFGPKSVAKDSISEMIFNIRSKWNNKLDQVYGVIKLGSVEATTPSTSIDSFKDKAISQFVNFKGANVGTHEGTLTVFFGETSSEFPISINVTEPLPEKEQLEEDVSSGNGLMIALAIIIAVILLILLVVVLKNKKKSD